MEYVYTALLLHAAGKQINEAAVTKVLESAGAKPDNAKVKALVASLKDINIDEAIKNASVVQAVATAPAVGSAPHGAKEEKKEDSKKTEEEAAEGLAGLFG